MTTLRRSTRPWTSSTRSSSPRSISVPSWLPCCPSSRRRTWTRCPVASADAVLRQLLPRYVATRLYQAVLELAASEQSAKMVAMRNATDNAQELIEDLTLTYNKVRQANITREMIEIATGASAA